MHRTSSAYLPASERSHPRRRYSVRDSYRNRRPPHIPVYAWETVFEEFFAALGNQLLGDRLATLTGVDRRSEAA